MDKIEILSIGYFKDVTFRLTPTFFIDGFKKSTSHLLVDSTGTSTILVPNRIVLHDGGLQAPIYRIGSDSHDLVHPVILSKMKVTPQTVRNAPAAEARKENSSTVVSRRPYRSIRDETAGRRSDTPDAARP